MLYLLQKKIREQVPSTLSAFGHEEHASFQFIGIVIRNTPFLPWIGFLMQ